MITNMAADYDIIDIRGKRLGSLNARSAQDAINTIKANNIIKSSGIYFLRSRATGKIQSLRIAK